MHSVDDIERAIGKLPAKQRWDLFTRLQDQLEDEWNRQIASDAASGRLDPLIKEAEEAIAAGRTRSLDEVLDDA